MGMDGGAKDGGGMMDAGVMPAPTGADGNCTGTCKGECSSNASGSCTSPCTGMFSGGICSGKNVTCSGSCNAAATGCQTTCTGTCVSNPGTKACTGTCTGGCSTTYTNASCTSGLKCDGSTQCHNACRASTALTVQCTAPVPDIRVNGDPALYAALRKHAGDFAAAASELAFYKDAITFMRNQTVGDFITIGASNEFERACVAASGMIIMNIDAKVTELTGASRVLSGSSF
jgi:hypothetical protein